MALNKIRILTLLFSFIFINELSSREAWLVSFTDKKNSTFSIDKPEEFLSQRSIERRAKYSISIVENDLPVSPAYLNSLKEIPGIEILHVTKWMNAAVITVDQNSILPVIKSKSFVKSIEKISPVKAEVPDENFTRSNERWSVEADEIYGYSWTQDSMLNVHRMHLKGYDGAGVWIGVFDAGFPNVYEMKAFSEMRNRGRLLGYYDFVNNDTIQSDDYHFHGTVVLSCMAALLPGSYIGTAPGASYWLMRTEDADSEAIAEEYNWVAAAEFADSVGIDIINSSLGYTTFDDSTFNHTYSDMDGNTTVITIAADLAVSKGIIVVNSAGNSGAAPWQYIGAPADGDSVIAAGGVDKNGNYAFFASKGPTADGRIKPDLSAMAFGTYLVWPDGNIAPGNGTSFSVPLISGMAATLLQAFPSSLPMEINYSLKECASRFLNPDTLIGYGIPDVFCSYQRMGGSSSLPQNDILISTYPNPFTSDITVQLYSPVVEEIKIELHDLSGKLLYSGTVNVSAHVISYIYCSDEFGDLSRGVYFLSITTGTEEFIEKIVKY